MEALEDRRLLVVNFSFEASNPNSIGARIFSAGMAYVCDANNSCGSAAVIANAPGQPTILLTAAHVVDGIDGRGTPVSTPIRAYFGGKPDLATSTPIYASRVYLPVNWRGWDANETTVGSDLAAIVLSSKHESVVHSISSHDLTVGMTASVRGYGRSVYGANSDPDPDNLQKSGTLRTGSFTIDTIRPNVFSSVMSSRSEAGTAPGDSGGPVFGHRGKIIGIVSGGSRPMVVGGVSYFTRITPRRIEQLFQAMSGGPPVRLANLPGLSNAFTEVRDTIAPVINAPSVLYATQDLTNGSRVTIPYEVQDDLDESPSVSTTALPGDLYPVGETVVEITAVDFRGNRSTSSVRIIVEPNPALTGFPEIVSLPLGGLTHAIAYGDFNRDGYSDVAVVNSNGLFVARNQWDRQLNPFQAINSRSASSLLASDIDGDGILDLVTTRSDAKNKIDVYSGNGDGTFRTPTTTDLAHAIQFLVAGDWNGDGRQDLLASLQNNKLVTLLSPSAGSPTPSQPIPTEVVLGLSTGDVNADGRTDLITLEETTNTSNQKEYSANVWISLANGSMARQHSYRLDRRPTALHVADVTGDGKADMVLATGSRMTNLSLWNGDGKGSFTLMQQADLPGEAQSLAHGDMTLDRKVDVVIQLASGSAYMLPGLGQAGLDWNQSRSIGLAGATLGMALDDMDRDGVMDILAVRSTGSASFLSMAMADGNPRLQLSPVASNFTQGVATPRQVIATFYDPNWKSLATDYVATISWGDGQSSVPELVNRGSGRWEVLAGHAYAEAKLYRARLQIMDGENRNSLALPIEVVDVPPILDEERVFMSSSGKQDGQLHGTFDLPDRPKNHYLSVDWGDGTDPQLFTLLPSQNSFSIPHRFQAEGLLTVSMTFSDGESFVAFSWEVTVALDRLELSLPATEFHEGSTFFATLTRNQLFLFDTTVSLSTDRPELIQFPTEVHFREGQDEVAFPVTVINNNISVGNQTLTLMATADRLAPTLQEMVVLEAEHLSLDIVPDRNVFPEAWGETQVTLTRNGKLDQPLEISLTNFSSLLQSPSVVHMDAQQREITFPISILDDPYADGESSALLLANAPGFPPLNIWFSIEDNDTYHLEWQLDKSTIHENGGPLTAQLIHNRTRHSGLSMSLFNGGVEALDLPNVANFPPGSLMSDPILITPIDDRIPGGDFDFTLTASLSNFGSYETTLTYIDDDIPEIKAVFERPQMSDDGSYQSITLTRNYSLNEEWILWLAVSRPDVLSVAVETVFEIYRESTTFEIRSIRDQVVSPNVSVEIMVMLGITLLTTIPLQVLDDDRWDWTNTIQPLDVSRDGKIFPLDALLVINLLNEHGASPISELLFVQPIAVDTNRDWQVSPLDALLILNHLNASGESEGEGEAADRDSTPSGEASILLEDKAKRLGRVTSNLLNARERWFAQLGE